jgi:lipopolysaccharide/colanic/teichoic acid biosynthesis glycosyltransferase
MFSQERTEPDVKNGFNSPHITNEYAGIEIPMRPEASPENLAECSDGQLPAVGVSPHSTHIPLWKRILDVSCIVIALPSLLPLVLIVAALIKLTSKGPILFKQERVGFLGRRFMVFKFRTMIVGADTADHEKHVANLIQTNGPMTKLDARGDKRLIPVGRLFRASGLDELPQFINVLRGEMSIVGPRPCLPSEYAQYLPWQKERFRALPGLTGLWQVSGKNRLTFNEMIDCDIRYARTQSLWLDLKIMFKTIPAVMGEVRDAQNPKASPALSNAIDKSRPARGM